MIWHDVWPKQRANATRKRADPEDIAYRKRVAVNKAKAASKAQAERARAERRVRAGKRTANAEITAENDRHDRAKQGLPCKLRPQRGK